MPVKHFGHQGNAPLHRHIWKAHQPRMGSIPYVDKLSKIGIDRHQDSAFVSGAFDQRQISRIGPKLTGLDDVMPLVAQPFGQAAAGTAIDKKSHASATDMADSVSLEITACA